MKIGIIGVGRIGGALLEGLENSDIHIYDMDAPKIMDLKAKIEPSPKDVAKKADLVFLAVPPAAALQNIELVKNELKGKTLVSLCAYVPIKSIKKIVPETKVIRIIPNLAMSVNEGVIVYSADETPVDALNILKKLGKVVIVEENQLDIMTGLFACSPAFIFELVNSLALLARKQGVEDELALELAIQTFFGTSKFAKESGYNTSRLIEITGVPGGSTEEGLKVMRDKKVGELFSEAVVRAIESAKKKTRKIANG